MFYARAPLRKVIYKKQYAVHPDLETVGNIKFMLEMLYKAGQLLVGVN